jgi:hypothetical protein
MTPSRSRKAAGRGVEEGEIMLLIVLTTDIS